ncbi:unnamed protein product [Ectocarpus sp. 8 AP-2014]
MRTDRVDITAVAGPPRQLNPTGPTKKLGDVVRQRPSLVLQAPEPPHSALGARKGVQLQQHRHRLLSPSARTSARCRPRRRRRTRPRGPCSPLRSLSMPPPPPRRPQHHGRWRRYHRRHSGQPVGQHYRTPFDAGGTVAAGSWPTSLAWW